MKYLPILLIFVYAHSFGQDFSYKDSSVFYEFFDTIPNLQKPVLFERIKYWATNYFKNPKESIALENKDLGKIVCKDYWMLLIKYGKALMDAPCAYTLDISIKDSIVQIQIFDLKYNRKVPLEIIKEDWSKSKKWAKGLDDIIRQINARTAYLRKSVLKTIGEIDSF